MLYEQIIQSSIESLDNVVTKHQKLLNFILVSDIMVCEIV